MDLSIISDIGIDVLSEKTRDEELVVKYAEKLEAAKKPRGQTELKIVEAIEKMVNFIYK